MLGTVGYRGEALKLSWGSGRRACMGLDAAPLEPAIQATTWAPALQKQALISVAGLLVGMPGHMPVSPADR